MIQDNFDTSEISLRKVGIEGIEELWWVNIDTKAFLSPLSDWINDRDAFLKFVKEKRLVVQAGGNCGMYARFYGNYFDQVYTFEPHPDNFRCLQLNCTDKKYHVHNVGLGKDFINATLKHPSTKKRRNMGVWQVQEDPEGSIKIITIDSLNLPRCDLLHLDVEEFEPNVLQGAEKTIAKYKPVIILEAGHGGDVAESYGYQLVEKLTTDWLYLHKDH